MVSVRPGKIMCATFSAVESIWEWGGYQEDNSGSNVKDGSKDGRSEVC